jgi:DNA helicase II / ATP-dependent DNA helicase PcrA
MTRYVLRTQHPVRSSLDLEHDLNEQQRAAVLAPTGQVLIIAGAGTGKTRTLTYRAAHLLSRGLAPDRMLLCTFTNRAAREMVRRVEGLLGVDLRAVWAGTFHHVANLALRRYGERVGLRANYSILDREDARDLLGSCISEEGKALAARRFPKPAVLQQLLSLSVDSQLSLYDALRTTAPRFLELEPSLARVAARYAARKLALGLVDYDDLLLFFKVLLTEHPEPAAELSDRFLHVLVDEYQDTSLIQGQIIDLCAARHGSLTVVGDDAQSIYSFRGADFRNIIDFPKRYPAAQIFKLEVNYRSTPEILTLANHSIEQNVRQFPKVLRAMRPVGMQPALLPLRDVYQQADFVAQRVLELSQEEAIPLDQIAVLYRAHSHSLELQVELSRRGVPYTVRSGLRFFEQAHIKDVTAYLRVAHNSLDPLAWQRILRLWPGVGARSTEQILVEVQSRGPDALASSVLTSPTLRERLPRPARPSVERLSQLLDALAGSHDVDEMIERVVRGHYQEYAQSAFANSETRLDDLRQLADYAARFESLEHFLSELALVAGVAAEAVGPGELPDEKLTLSTVHQAKGLEWRAVFILWLSDGRFPQAMAVRAPAEEEEERRLFHVAVTRAMDHLYLCQVQFEEGGEGPRHLLRLSRFLSELAGHTTPYERWEIEEAPP